MFRKLTDFEMVRSKVSKDSQRHLIETFKTFK